MTTNTSAPYLIGLSSPEQTPNSITVAWSAPYNGGSAITGYEVQYRLSGDTVWTAWSETIAADATSLTVTDLLVSRAYQFQGRAVSDVGSGSWSSALNRSTKSPPEQVTGLVLSSSDETNLSISWQRPSSLEAIVRYEIEYRENTSDNSATWTRRTTEASVLSITIGDDTALTLDTSYEIRVRAVSSQGSGLWSVLLFAATAAGPEEPASFGTQMVSNQGYVQGESITDLVFPEATSGSGTKTYRLTPALPGLNFDTATRTISGTPTQANTHNMTYTVSNSVGSDSLSFIIAVAAADTAPSFGSSTLATQTFQKAVDIGKVQLPPASGGNGTLAYSLTPVVPGLTYNAATQLLTGRPTIAASVSMTYTVTDSDANTDTTDEETLTFTIEVKNTPSEFLPGSQVSDKLFLVGRGITPVVFPAASGGEGEITYSLVPPVPGLILDGAARRWEGTPTEEVDYMVSLVAEDADGARAAIQFHVVVKLNKSEPTFGDVKSVAWEIGESQGPYAPVGSTPVVTAVADNRLIYSLAGDDAASFRVRGDGQVEVGPGTRLDYEVRETYSFVLEVRDGLDAFGVGDDVIDDWLTVTVTVSDEDEDVFGVRFGSDGSPSGVRDQDYLVGQRIIPIQLPGAQGGAGNLTYTLSPLPPGLSFDARALLLTGTPSQEWDQDATLTAKDGRGALGRVYFGIRVTPRAERPEFGDWAWISDQVYVLNRDIEPLELPRASGGNEPLEYTLEPRVPGLYFDGANLQLSGVPGQASAHAMRYQVVDRDGDRKVLEFQVRVVSEEQLALIVGPGMPTELSASTVGENTDPVVVVSWRAPGVVGSAPVTHYDVERSANGLVWQEIARVEAVPGRTELIYSDDEVVRGEEWSYRVMAVNDMSAGLSSEMVSVVVGSESRVTGGLQPPGGLDYLVNEALVRIFWTNSGSGNAYQVDVWYAGQNDWVSHANGGTMNEWAVELSCCDDADPVPEWARVRTVQVHGPQDQSESAWSDSLRIYTEEQVIGEVLAPTGLDAVMDHGLIQLWWADVTNMSGYQVEMRDTEGSDAQWRGVDHGAAGLVRTNRTLVACCYEEEFYGYQFRVRSVLLSRDGRSNYSDWSLPLGLPIDRRPGVAETVVEPTAAAPVETEIVAQVPPNDEFTPIIEAGQMGGPGFVANDGVSFLGMEVKGFAGFLVLALAAAIGGVSVLIYVRRRGEAALEEGLELAPRSTSMYYDDIDDDGRRR